MALGDAYATLEELKVYVSITETNQFDESLTNALDAASRDIENYCDRQFNKATTATPRTYEVDRQYWAEVDEFWTTSGLVIEVDRTGDGVFEETWSASDYQVFPLNGIVRGQSWPYSELQALNGKYLPVCYPSYGRTDRLRVTAQWGWPGVPSPVKQACLMLAAKNFQVKDAPLGFAGSGDLGYIRVGDDRGAQAKLRPYKRESTWVA